MGWLGLGVVTDAPAKKDDLWIGVTERGPVLDQPLNATGERGRLRLGPEPRVRHAIPRHTAARPQGNSPTVSQPMHEGVYK